MSQRVRPSRHATVQTTRRGLLADIAAGLLDPAQFVARTITLDDTPDALMAMSAGTEPGVTIIRPWHPLAQCP